jgi:hypothetical protein
MIEGVLSTCKRSCCSGSETNWVWTDGRPAGIPEGWLRGEPDKEGVVVAIADIDGGFGWGMLSRRSALCPAWPKAPEPRRRPRGLGLRLLKLPIGLANPLLLPPYGSPALAGVTTEILSPDSGSWRPVRMVAAESKTEGTESSSCSVAFALGMRCGLEEFGGEGETNGSISRSNMAEEEEWLLEIRGMT